MRKQVIHTILSAFLCASGFAQREIVGETQLVHLLRGYNAIGWNATSTADFEKPWRNAEAGALEGRANSCASARSTLLELVALDREQRPFQDVPVWQLPNSRAFFFVSGMTIDADGAPNAYNPDDTGLDELANAGAPSHWDGIVTDLNGNLLIQQESDPFPGYYISCTSLSDKTKKFDDQTGYVDASKIPYVVLPKDIADRGAARLGDFAFVMNLRNGKSSFAIYADIGTLGEGSVALANALGIRPDARRGGQSDGILYLLYAGSGNQRPRTIGEIQSEGEEMLVSHAGDMRDLSSCIDVTIMLSPTERF
jgi:hypothetical protein